MKIVLSSRKHHWIARLGIFLIAIVLIVGTVSCGGGGGAVEYSLSMAVNPVGGGTAGDLTNFSPYTEDTPVAIKAVANPGYRFTSWTAPAGIFINANAAQTTFIMPAQNVTVTANFVPLYNLTMAVAPAGNGTAADLTNASPYAAGTLVNIQAVAGAGCGFRNWTAPAGTFGNATAALTTFTMPAQAVTVTANFGPFAGSGIEGDPYQIADWYQLNNVRNYLDSHFILVNDLNSATAGYTELANSTADGGKGWQPIGNYTSANFTGTFDGQGYEISGLFIDRPAQDHVGLFGSVDVGGVIESVEVMGANVTGNWSVGILVGGSAANVSHSSSSGSVSSANNWAGGLVGWNHGTVDSSYSTANVTGHWIDKRGAGGLVGYNDGNVSNCYAAGVVYGDYIAGGLVGHNYDGGTVSNSYAIGNVTGKSGDVSNGGLVGENYYSTVYNSYATGNVSAYKCVGGLVGCNNHGTVTKCYATGSVTGTYDNGFGDSFGGLVGWNRYGTVSDSYAIGNVTSGGSRLGGLVGCNEAGTVSNSYSTGSVTGGSILMGGLVGQNLGSVNNSFWDTQTSGQGSSAGGTGKNTTEMQDIDTFSGVGWDIVAVANSGARNTSYIWNIVDDVTYAFLSWRPV